MQKTRGNLDPGAVGKESAFSKYWQLSAVLKSIRDESLWPQKCTETDKIYGSPIQMNFLPRLLRKID